MHKRFMRYLWSIVILLALYDLSAVCLLRSYYVLGCALSLMFLAFAYANQFLSMAKILIIFIEKMYSIIF